MIDTAATATAETGTTHVLFVTDKSGSMDLLAADVRGGFNSYVDTLRQDGNAYRLSVTLFDTEHTELCADAPIGEVPQMDARNYVPFGSTALLDAVGNTITRFRAAHPSLPEGDRALLVIQTDGQENSSREYSYEGVSALIQAWEAGGWTVLYFGAGAEAWDEGARLGVSAHSILRTSRTGKSTSSGYAGLASASMAYAGGANADEVARTVRSTPGVVDPDAE